MAEYQIGQRYRGSGVTMPGLAGETIPRGAAVYMSAADGLWYLADSDAAATVPAVGIVSDAGTAGNVIQILVLGLIERSDWTWTRGDPLYISGTAGVLTQTAPATNTQSIAVAITATLIYVSPQTLVREQMFEYQTPATLNQAAPVQNTWYTILDTTANVRVYNIAVAVEDTNETIELQAIVDGETIAATALAATHSTEYKAFFFGVAITRIDSLGLIAGNFTEWNRGSAFLFDGRSVQVRMRKTTAAGAGNLTAIVNYGVLSNS